MKTVMIITANKTGTGHKSSANALEYQLKEQAGDKVNVIQVDAFEFMGKMGVRMENSYIPLTTKHPKTWGGAYYLTKMFNNSICWMLGQKSKHRFLAKIDEVNPDVVVTNHPMFNTSLGNILKKYRPNIPFYVNVIDLVKLCRMWHNKKADFLFLPTQEEYQRFLKKGHNADKMLVTGFPIRDDIKTPTVAKRYDKDKKLNVLMVNPNLSIKKNVKFLKNVSKIPNVSIDFVCGRDEKLFNALKSEIAKDIKMVIMQDEGRLSLKGFVSNMNELLSSVHIVVTKAGPNMILEASKSGAAVVVSGHIPGQEAHNFEHCVKYGYGIKCESPNKVEKVLLKLLKDDAKLLNNMFENALKVPSANGAISMANKILLDLNLKQ